MSEIRGWAALGAKQKLVPFSYDPGPLGPEEVEVAVDYCGMRYSDVAMINSAELRISPDQETGSGNDKKEEKMRWLPQ